MVMYGKELRNSLQIHEGFSSHQLVLGRNPDLPNVLSSSPSSLEASTPSEKFAKQINSLHAARKAFIESESCEKIKRALKSKIRASEQVFNPGDKVYYKIENQERWLGPAKVIFQDGKVVFVRHGAVWIKVSPNRLVKSGKEFQSVSSKINSPHVHDDDLRSEDDGDINITHDDDHNGSERHPGDTPGDKLSDGNNISSNAATTSTDSLDLSGKPTNDSGKQSVLEERVPEGLDDQDELREHDGVYILSRTQRLINREHGWEVYCSTPSITITEWQVFSSEVPKELYNSPECLEAKQDELHKLAMFDVYDEVPNNGQECISTR